MNSFGSRILFFKLMLLCSHIRRTHTTRDNNALGNNYFDDFREEEEIGKHASHLHRWSPRKIDLLECLDLRNRSIEGIEYRPGPHSPTPAAYFGSGHREAAFVSEARCFRISQLLEYSSSEDVSLMASVKQRKGNAGSLLSIVDSKNSRLLELQSSGRQDVIRLHYRSSMSSSIVETIPVALADDKWHKLSISLSGDTLRVFLDCRSVYHKIIHPLRLGVEGDDIKNLTLWVGQSNKNHFLFKGYLQNFHLVTGRNGHLVQCPNAEASCPTCGEFRALQEIVQNLQTAHLREISELKRQLVSVESRLEKVEECECAKSCKTGSGIVRGDGSSWNENCQTCTCESGEIKCKSVTCPAAHCRDPRPANVSNGICCPTCAACIFSGHKYDHGASISPSPCMNCSCDNGRMKCLRKNTDQDPCPSLNCPIQDQILEDGQCCKVCKADHCARGHDCHPQANCINLDLNYTCSCRHGFIGDGKHCEDIDECQRQGDSSEFPLIKGHHCSADHSICINTFGSYNCECDNGYEKVPSSNGLSIVCRRRDVCNGGKSPCHSNATCRNTAPGEYDCVCKNGYRGDGVKECHPVCEQGCENGGTCDAPDHCSCPSGFSGPWCQLDINECTEGFNRCGGEARCVNKPGWYYCQCRSGYRTYQDPFSDGQTVCIDEDECEMGSHSCHPSTICVNNDGSYECQCEKETGCSSDCVMEDGKELKQNGSTWSEGCNTCSCMYGKISCSPPKCNCSKLPDRGCCPECYDKTTCSHIPEDSTIDRVPRRAKVFRSGDRWLENCKECECLHGEVDCWPIDCPPTPPDCLNIITHPGDCCPSCSQALSWLNSTNGDMCHHQGSVRKNGERWALDDECTQCDCKIPCCDKLVSSSTSLASRTVLYIVLLVLHVSLWIFSPQRPFHFSDSSLRSRRISTRSFSTSRKPLRRKRPPLSIMKPSAHRLPSSPHRRKRRRKPSTLDNPRRRAYHHSLSRLKRLKRSQVILRMVKVTS